MFFRHSMSIAHQLMPIYNTTVIKNKSNVALNKYYLSLTKSKQCYEQLKVARYMYILEIDRIGLDLTFLTLCCKNPMCLLKWNRMICWFKQTNICQIMTLVDNLTIPVIDYSKCLQPCPCTDWKQCRKLCLTTTTEVNAKTPKNKAITLNIDAIIL